MEGRSAMPRLRTVLTIVALCVCGPIAARADVVLDWNAIAVSTVISQGQNPFAQARFMAITQLAVFEAVNVITGDYKPYVGTVVAPAGASADAAAVACIPGAQALLPAGAESRFRVYGIAGRDPRRPSQERRHCDGPDGGCHCPEVTYGRGDVARFYAVSSPSFVFNLAARKVAAAKGSSLSENARVLALLNMASNDSLVASFWTKYHYNVWRPETAIFEGDLDGNAKTDADATFVPYILTPCFPSYPSNHGSASNSAAEILRRVYGAGGHAITMANAAVPGLTFHYTSFNQITDDISDARVYGRIHLRFDQDAGADLGHDVATYVYKHNLRAKHSDNDDEGDNE